MNFNFNNLSETNFSSNAAAHLRPYGIYKVNLTKIEKTELKGAKDPNAVYPVVTLEFTGTGEGDSNGIFTQNLFIPTSDADMERPTYENKEGHQYQRPSRFENFQFTLMQIVHALNPEGEEKIKNNGDKIKTIDQFIDLIIKAVAKKSDVVTDLKLVGRTNNGVVYATLPNACGLNKSGELFPTNFIGSNLSFSNYEMTQMKQYQNAKPTDMALANSSSASNSNDVDLDDIEL